MRLSQVGLTFMCRMPQMASSHQFKDNPVFNPTTAPIIGCESAQKEILV